MIKKLISGQINSITVAAFLVALSSLISRFLGVFRDRVLAGQFGAGETLDVYYAAFRIPDLIFNLLVLGALSAGFVPVFTALIKQPKEKIKEVFGLASNKEAWEFANVILNIMGLGLLVISLAGILFAPLMMKILTPGFSPSEQALTASLTRLMFLSPIFLGISSVFGGILQSYKRFFVYSLSPILYNLGIILGALYLVPSLGIYGLAWGVVLGAFLHMFVQIPLVFKLGFRYRPKIDLKNKSVREVGRIMAPRALSLGVSQINLLVITAIASTLSAGSLAVFNFANNLQSFPIGLFGISFAVAAFPALSAIASNDKKFAKSFSSTVRQILFFIVPATVLLLTLRAQIIRVILGTGNFSWEDTIMTMNTLGFFSVSLFAQAVLPLLVRMFYARCDSKTPFIAGFFSALVNIALSIYFAGAMGVAGLALAFSIANIINFLVLWLILSFRIGGLDENKILFSVIKFTASAVALGITVQGMKFIVAPYVDMDKLWGIFAQGALAAAAGLFAYAAFCALFRTEEMFNFWASIKRRLPFRKVATGDHGEARGI